MNPQNPVTYTDTNTAPDPDSGFTSDPTLAEFTCGAFHFKGRSLAGFGSTIILPELDLAFDCYHEVLNYFSIGTFLITHGHMDHCAGLLPIISLKNLQDLPTGRFYIPPEIQKPLIQIIELWQQMEDHQYDYELIPVTPQQLYPLKGNYWFKAFPTYHRVPSIGYTIYDRRQKLKKIYQGLTGPEIVNLKKQGLEITDELLSPLITYSGDSRIEFLDADPTIRKSKILFIECTYLDDSKSIEQARLWGHIHLDELVTELPRIDSEQIVITHVSARYSREQIEALLKKKVPAQDLARISVFMR